MGDLGGHVFAGERQPKKLRRHFTWRSERLLRGTAKSERDFIGRLEGCQWKTVHLDRRLVLWPWVLGLSSGHGVKSFLATQR